MLNYGGYYEDISDLIDRAIASYVLDRWQKQDYYIEVWVEKDAISSFIKRVTDRFQIPLMVNRGYSSATAVYKGKKRLNKKLYLDQKNCVILYLGDHDPSGLNMIEDIEKRLGIFRCHAEIDHIALTMAQIKKYKPSPNPTKITDSRSKRYIKMYGNDSWEIEALKPTALVKILEDNIKKYLDKDKFQEVINREEEDKERLRDIMHRDFDN